jgi:hypothetical protein
LRTKDHDSVFITMDKLDKIGANGILSELESKEFSKDAISAMINDVTQFEVGDFNHLYLNDEVKKVIEAVSLSANGNLGSNSIRPSSAEWDTIQA